MTSPPISPSSINSWLQQASPQQQQAALNTLALQSPAGFATIASSGKWKLAPHLALINRKLVDVAEGRIKRLLISMPPRHGKSQLVSTYTPPWYLSKYPHKRVILAAYEHDFAASWGRKSRDITNEHSKLLGIDVHPQLARAHNWQIRGYDGGMLTAGVGGPLTGYGADLLIFDDPIKNSEQANSPTYREKTWEWWQSTAYTRLMPGAAVIGIMTRWHEDDLIGRIFKTDEHWEVVNLPAIADEDDPLGRQPGEALWPERFPLPDLERIRSTLGSYYWSALYQGVPSPREGGFFQSRWFKYLDLLPVIEPPKPPTPPPGLRIRAAYTPPPKTDEYVKVRAWDLAATEDGDWTVGTLIAKHRESYFISDVVRERLTPAARDNLILRTAKADGVGVKQWFEQEPGSAGVSVVAHLRKLLTGFATGFERPTGPKQVRAEAMAAALESGSVTLVRGAWNDRFVQEFTQFPNGRHDDQVDATSLAFNKLALSSELVAL